MSKAVLVDVTRCTGCRGCQVACKEWNERVARPTVQSGTYENPKALSSDCYTRIRFEEKAGQDGPVWDFVKDQCLHCNSPACAAACPVGALVKTDAGPVVYSYDRCIGCRYCLIACPFDIPKYEWESTMPWVQKCTFCSERLSAGMAPACVHTCPTGALVYGDDADVVATAWERIARDNQAPPEIRRKYTGKVYGEKEAGGTAWKYIADRPFAELGLNTKVGTEALPAFTWSHLSKIPVEIVLFGAALGGLAAIRARNTKGGE